MTTARGIRNQNPGNIEAGSFTQRQPGYTGPEPEGRFATFETMGHGIAALIALLRVYRKQHGLTTVRGIINRWAPPSENVTSAYVTAVCDGWVTPDEELPDSPETYLFLAQRIARHENGADAAKITHDQWEAGMSLAGFAVPTLNEVIVDAPQPAPKKKEGIVAPFAAIAWKALLTSIPTLIRHFGSGERSEENAKLAEIVVPLATQAIGAANEQELTERLVNDPGAIQTVDKAVQESWLVIAEAGGGGIAGARAADAAIMAMDGPWWGIFRSPSFWALWLLLPLVYLIVLSIIGVVGNATWSDDVRAAIAGTIVGTIVGGAVGYYWGQVTSRNRGPAGY